MLFIKKKNSDDHKILAFSETTFTLQNYSDCYGDHGQIIGHCDAGDCFELTEEQANGLRSFWGEEHPFTEDYKPRVIISASDEPDSFDYLIEQYPDDVIADTVMAYTYWDGHNWKSIIIDSDAFGTHEVVPDELAIALKAICESDEFRFTEERTAVRSYTNGEYTFTEYNLPNHPELFEVEEV